MVSLSKPDYASECQTQIFWASSTKSEMDNKNETHTEQEREIGKEWKLMVFCRRVQFLIWV